MVNPIKIIVGGSHTDERGTISFINGFDMTPVKRFYQIKHPNTSIIRAWRGHQIEQRWFSVSKGAFLIKLVKITNWDMPDKNSFQEKFVLKAADHSVLHVPAGYASSLQALEEDSELLVFADYDINHARQDDYLFPSDYFIASKDSKNEN